MNVSTTQSDAANLASLDRILAGRPHATAGDLIPILQEIQAACGYLPRPVLLEMSRRTGIAASRIYGVATFYEQFHLEPHGRHTVRCCRGTACHVREGARVIKAVKQHLGVEEGQTTSDMQFTLETVACLGVCALSPVMVIDNTYYGKMTPHRARTILQSMESPQGAAP